MRVRLSVLIVVLTLLLSGIFSPAGGAVYFGYDEWGGTWHDANKDWSGDYNLCWAAAASNILDWGGWEAPGLNTEALIFEDFEDHWTDEGSLAEYGWHWWFDGINPRQGDSGWAQVNVPGGGNHFPTLSFGDYFHEDWSGNLMASIDRYLHDGYGVTIAIYGYGGGGHALTVWGYEDNGSLYTRIYYTDSDDFSTGLMSARVTWDWTNGVWRLGGAYQYLWYIGGVQALDRGPTSGPVPEPGTIILILSGLIGAVFYRKRFKA